MAHDHGLLPHSGMRCSLRDSLPLHSQFNETERPQSDFAPSQLLSPILLLIQQDEFLERLLSGGWAKEQGAWISISVFVVVVLFNIINQEIFAKQVRNSLIVRRLRNVVWNSTGSWQVRTS